MPGSAPFHVKLVESKKTFAQKAIVQLVVVEEVNVLISVSGAQRVGRAAARPACPRASDARRRMRR